MAGIREAWQNFKKWTTSPPTADDIDENTEAGRIAREQERRRRLEKEIQDEIDRKN
jgi:hypothetical protein